MPRCLQLTGPWALAADTGGGGEAPCAPREKQAGGGQVPEPAPGADGPIAGGECNYGQSGPGVRKGGHLQSLSVRGDEASGLGMGGCLLGTARLPVYPRNLTVRALGTWGITSWPTGAAWRESAGRWPEWHVPPAVPRALGGVGVAPWF